mgnify:CR=1 FL=1
MDNLKAKKRHPEEIAVYSAIYVCAAFSVLLLLGIIIYVFAKGARRVNWAFLTGVTSILHGTVGIAGNILNTLIIILLTMIITTPIGVGAAIYLNEYAKPGKLVTVIIFATETLAGIPSIIFGLFGMLFFGQLCHMGYSLLTGSLTLTLMVLPLVTRNTQEALKTVPDSFRTGAVGLGAGKWYTIRTILLPSAMPGIVTGVILAIGRIVGETAALIYTAGTVAEVSKGLLSSGRTLAIHMYVLSSEGLYTNQAYATAVVLLIFVLIINFMSSLVAKKFAAKD